MGALGYFREDGLPNSAQHATKVATDISTPTVLVSGNNGDVNITDIVVSKNSDGDITFYNGTGHSDQVITTLYIKSSDNGNSTDVVNFTSALKVTDGSGLYVGMDQTDTDYSILVNYYTSNRR